jgi:hypothetical protein
LSMLYSREDLSLMLVDHERSFGADLERPAYLKDIAPAIGDQWRSALSELTDEAMADILVNGNVAELSDGGSAWKLVQVTTDEQSVFAYFREQSGEERDAPELAAYRLDRMLQLGMVPVTVRREIAGTQGTLQFVPMGTVTELERVATGKGAGAPCSLGKQKGAMHVFDALINNSARTPSSMLYGLEDGLLVLVGHERSFGANPGRPAYLEDIELAVGDQWRSALSELNDEALRAELGDVLDDDRLAALGVRRDALLDNSPALIPGGNPE